jgi:hypothetical protein
VIAVLGVLLAGCAEPASQPQPSATTPAASPTATEQVLPAGAGAVLPFACDEILDPATWDRVAGGAMPTEPAATVFGEAIGRTRGQDSCSWYRADPYTNVRVSVYLRDETGEDPIAGGWTGEFGVADSAMRCDADPMGAGCHAQAVVGDYYLSTYFHGRATTVAAAKADTRNLFAPVIAALQQSPAPEVWSMPADAWPAIVDCAALDAAGDISGAAGVAGMTVSDVIGQSEDGTTPRDVFAAWGETRCEWAAPDPDADPAIALAQFHVLAGGGWLWRDLVPNAGSGTLETVDIAGADDAALECPAPDDCHLVLRFGPNAAFVDGTQKLVYGPGVALTRDQLLALGEELSAAVGAVL